MKLYKLSLELKSAIITPFKGDTIFGHFCWAFRELVGLDALKRFLYNYEDQPKIIFSDAFKKDYLPKPTIPFSELDLENTYVDEIKNNRKKIKGYNLIKASELMTKSLQNLTIELISEIKTADKEIVKKHNFATQSSKKYLISHNTINRNTGTTGDGIFSPYQVATTNYKSKDQSEDGQENNKFDIYFLFDQTDDLNIEIIKQCFINIGKFGYGADATIGLGKFDIINDSVVLIETPEAKTNLFMNLSPVVPDINVKLENSFYNIFTRFGRLGNIGSFNSNPFKQPILTIDCGGLLFVSNLNLKYIGRGVRGTVKNDLSVVYQGYSIILPILVK